jgi:hypothetical protein
MRILCPIALAAALAGCATAPSPVTELTGAQATTVTGYTEVALASAGFTTQAMARVNAKPAKAALDVSRHANAASGAYGGVGQPDPVNPPPGPVTAAPPAATSFFDFKKSGDSAQAWATTTVAGMPFIALQTFGQAGASGAASWRARITTTPGHENVYVRFRLPAAELTGFTEQNGPSPYQVRMRADLSVNGHPFWSSEASRRSTLAAGGMGGGGDNCANGFEGSNKLFAFGQPLGFTEDKAVLSTARVTTLWLGAFPAGQTVEIAFLVRADALVERQCCPHDAMGKPEFFCTRATANVKWDNAASPVTFWIGPAVV